MKTLFFVGVGVLTWLAVYCWAWWCDRQSALPWERKQSSKGEREWLRTF